MALHWAIDPNVQMSQTQANASGYLHYFGTIYSTAAVAFPRNPPIGYGGMSGGFACTPQGYINTPCPPKGALSDGGLQFHVYYAVPSFYNGSSYIRLRDQYNSTQLLELRANGTAGDINVYSHNTLRGALSQPFAFNQWMVIGIRFKDDTVAGRIQVSIDGVTVFDYTGNTGGTDAWGPVFFYYYLNGTAYSTGWTWWDDPTNDEFLTKTWWIGTTVPASDAAAGGFSPSVGVDLYACVDDGFSTAPDYIESTTNPDEVRFGIDMTAVSPKWAPKNIAGVIVTPLATGQGYLDRGRVTINDGAGSSSDGTDTNTTTGPTCTAADVFAVDATGADWTAASVGAHQYGVKVS